MQRQTFLLLSSIAFLLAVVASGMIWHYFAQNREQRKNLSQSSFAQANLPPQELEHHWIVSATQGQTLVNQQATLLDARHCPVFPCRRLPGAVSVSWQDFSQSEPRNRGKLLEDDAILTAKLQELGIDQERAVVVVGDPKTGWGEEGRIVWMLRTLGHSQAVLVDGGYRALSAVGLEEVKFRQAGKGNFVVQRRQDWQISRQELQDRLGQENVVTIDSRSKPEYNGKTPYGEVRGGHVPGAIHLHYRDLLAADGRLLPREEILSKLREKGITPKLEIISYCTGGVRSGWLTAVLIDLGFDAKNYAGSMWEWSASPESEYPLRLNSL